MSDNKDKKADDVTPPATSRRRNLNEHHRGLDTSPISAAVNAALGSKDTAKPKSAPTQPDSASKSK